MENNNKSKMSLNENNKVPKLRFPEFTDEWKISQLKNIFYLSNGLNKDKKYFGFGNPIINYLDVNKNVFLTKEIIKGNADTNAKEITRFSVFPNDVLFTRTSEMINEIGLTSCLTEIIPKCTFSGFLLRARPIDCNLISLFFVYEFRSIKYRNKIIKVSTETSRALINCKNLEKIIISYPSCIYEQQKISSFLYSLDKKINITTDKIKVLKQYKKGLLESIIFSWKKKSKKIHLYDLVNYKNSLLLINSLNNVEKGNYPIFDASGKSFVSVNFFLNNQDSIGIIKYGSSCGKIFNFKGKHSVIGTLGEMIPKDSSDIDFIYYYLLSNEFKRITKKYTEIGTTPNLYFSDYSIFSLSYFEKEKRNQFCLIFKNLDILIQKSETILSKIILIKQFLLNKLFI